MLPGFEACCCTHCHSGCTLTPTHGCASTALNVLAQKAPRSNKDRLSGSAWARKRAKDRARQAAIAKKNKGKFFRCKLCKDKKVFGQMQLFTDPHNLKCKACYLQDTTEKNYQVCAHVICCRGFQCARLLLKAWRKVLWAEEGGREGGQAIPHCIDGRLCISRALQTARSAALMPSSCADRRFPRPSCASGTWSGEIRTATDAAPPPGTRSSASITTAGITPSTARDATTSWYASNPSPFVSGQRAGMAAA